MATTISTSSRSSWRRSVARRSIFSRRRDVSETRREVSTTAANSIRLDATANLILRRGVLGASPDESDSGKRRTQKKASRWLRCSGFGAAQQENIDVIELAVRIYAVPL